MVQFSGSTILEYGPTALHKCVLGEANRHEGDGYIVNLLGTEEVKEVAAAIGFVDEAWMCGATPFKVISFEPSRVAWRSRCGDFDSRSFSSVAVSSGLASAWDISRA